jgi:hypothetical protein
MLVRRLGYYGGAVTALLRSTPPAEVEQPARQFEPDRSQPLSAGQLAAMGGEYEGVGG